MTRPAVSWGLTSAGLALGTYFAMLFVLALYLQEGLGRTPLYSGLALVSWVAAFGISGQILKRLGSRKLPHLPAIGFLILAATYLSISATLALDLSGQAILITLLGFGGLGFGLGRNSAIVQVINNVPDGWQTRCSSESARASSSTCSIVSRADTTSKAWFLKGSLAASA